MCVRGVLRLYELLIATLDKHGCVAFCHVRLSDPKPFPLSPHPVVIANTADPSRSQSKPDCSCWSPVNGLWPVTLRFVFSFPLTVSTARKVLFQLLRRSVASKAPVSTPGR